MATYLILNLAFMAAVILLAGVPLRKPSRGRLGSMLVLLGLTALFDSLIVGLHIVSYDPAKILGIFIGKAPLEDFCYAILAAILVPHIWRRLGKDE